MFTGLSLIFYFILSSILFSFSSLMLLFQVRVLTDLGMLSEAIRVLMDLLLGEKLPKISDVGFRTVNSKTVRYSRAADLVKGT